MALKRKLSVGREWVTNEVFLFACWLVSLCLPRTRWYAAALWMARALAGGVGWLAPTANNATDASLAPRLLHRFLDILANHSRDFSIPVVVEGGEFLQEYSSSLWCAVLLAISGRSA